MNTEARLTAIENELRKIQQGLVARPADQAAMSQVRLAKTKRKSGYTYPTDGYIFPFVFHKGIKDDEKLNDIAVNEVIEINKVYIPEGQMIAVWQAFGVWHTRIDGSEARFVLLNCKNTFDMSLAKLTTGGNWQRLVDDYIIVSLVGDSGNCYKVVAYDPTKHSQLDGQCSDCYRVENEYGYCKECKQQWRLENCNSSGTPLEFVTTTDVAEHKGKTLKIKDREDCFKVMEPWNPKDNSLGAPEEIEIIAVYEDTGEGEDLVPGCDKCNKVNRLLVCDFAGEPTDSDYIYSYTNFTGKFKDVKEPENDTVTGSVWKFKDSCLEFIDQVALPEGQKAQNLDEATYISHDCSTACPCYELTPACPGEGSYKKTKQAVNKDGTIIELSDTFNNTGPIKVVRLDDGFCYTVAIYDGVCTGHVKVTVLMKYDIEEGDAPCDPCKLWVLEPAPCHAGDSVTTWEDLGADGFEPGHVIKLYSADGEEFDPPRCFLVTNDPGFFEDAVDIEYEDKTYDTCEECNGQQIFKVAASGCQSTNCDGGEAPPYEEKYTTNDLSQFVGKFAQDNGRCVKVTAVDEIPGDQTDVTVFLDGPYPSCIACNNDKTPKRLKVLRGDVCPKLNEAGQFVFKTATVTVLDMCPDEDCVIETEEECED